jgi:uroporphyrinogen III methyltransferase / synthase
VAEPPAKPLAGRIVVVTRPQAQAAALADPLAELGAEVLLAPTIRIAPTHLNDQIRAAVRAVRQYDLVVFTSANAVREFTARLHECGGTVHTLGGALVAVVGPATAAAAHESGMEPALMAEEFVAEGLLAALDERDVALAGARVLLPRAAEARDVLLETLRARGATVDVLTVYETQPAPALAVPAACLEGADFITFTSASAARGFAELMGDDPTGAGRRLAARLAGTRLCSIGPQTSVALAELGLPVAVEAEPHTSEGLVQAIVALTAQG